jgi:hypothetical protein
MHLDYDSATNTLRLTLDQPTPNAIARTITLDGTIDVSAQGRLVGVEFRLPDTLALDLTLRPWLADPVAGEFTTIDPDGSAYIQMTVGDDRDARSTALPLQADFDPNDHLLAIAIPRRGAGFEISYPSGNQ